MTSASINQILAECRPVTRIYLRVDIGLRELWDMEQLMGDRTYHLYRSKETADHYIVMTANDPIETLIRLKFGK